MSAHTIQKLTIALDKDLKDQVREILESLGLNQSQAVIAFFKEIVRTGKVPLSFDTNDVWREPTRAETQLFDDFDDRLASDKVKTKPFQELLSNQAPINID